MAATAESHRALEFNDGRLARYDTDFPVRIAVRSRASRSILK